MYNPLASSEKGPGSSERAGAAQVLYVELMEGMRALDIVAGPTVAALDAAERQQASEAQVQAQPQNPLFEKAVTEAIQAADTPPPASELTVDSARAALEEIWREAA